MRSFRPLASLIVAFLPCALAAQRPAAPAPQRPAAPMPAQVRLPGMSPAGNATIGRLQSRPDPAMVAQARQEAAFRADMAAVLKAPAIDVDKLAAMLKRGQRLTAQGRALADDHLVALIRALSPPDRVALVRAMTTAPVPAPAPAPGR